MESTQSSMKYNTREYALSRGYDRLTHIHKGRQTTTSIEQIFKECLDDMAHRNGLSRSAMIERITDERSHCNKARAIRVAVVVDLLEQLSEFKKLDLTE